jgi:predicted MFS family arabinose efflux permease
VGGLARAYIEIHRIEYKRDPLAASFTIRRLFGVLRENRDFRTLYAANAVSQTGDWFNVVALFSLLLELTGKGEAVALALLTRFVPMFFAGPAAGVLADRVSRRAILVVSDLLRVALVLCLLLVRRPDQVWIAYAVVTAHSIVSAFFEPAQQAMLPNLVSEADYPLAATLENSLWAATLAVGSALGGVALALVGRDAAFVFDAFTFLGSAALLARLPPGHANRADKQAIEVVEEAREPGSQIQNLLGLRDLREGVRYVASHRRVRALLAVKASFGLTLGGVLVLLAYFGEKVFARGNGAGIAVLWTARGVGSFAGPFAAFRLAGTDERGLRRSISGAFALLAVCYVAFALSPSIGYAAVALAIANGGGSILWTSGSTLLQRLVPDAVRGRVAAAEIGGFMLTLSASTVATGLLLDRGVPPRALMAACGLVALVPLAYWGFAQRAFQVTGRGTGE